MFDPKYAFKCLDGKLFTHDELDMELARIRAQYVTELPVEFEVEDLYQILNAREWLSGGSERIYVRIK